METMRRSALNLRKRFSKESQAWIATVGTLALVFALAIFYDSVMRSASSSSDGTRAARPSWMGKMPARRLLETGGAREDSYALIIDAGSSGSRVHVYRLKWVEGQAIPKVELPDKKLKVKPGLSSFSGGKEDQAGVSLAELMEFAMKHVPASARKDTPVILSATAGLRMVPPESAKRILDNCYEYMKSKTPFKVERSKVSVITGEDEGALGWLSINYLMGRLKGMPNESEGTVGGVEMGGASSQVTFLSPDRNAVKAYRLRVAGETYPLYTHSYLGYGQEEARKKVNEGLGGAQVDPCMPKGYTKEAGKSPDGVYGGHEGKMEGGGDYDACREKAMSILDKKATCARPPCSFGGVHMPDMKAAGSMIVFENFYHTSKNAGIAGMEKGVSPDKFAEYGRKFCSTPWKDLHSDESPFPALKGDSQGYAKTCFSLAYLSAFLQHGLNLQAGDPIPVLGNVDGADIEWALGQMIVEVTGVKDASGSAQDKQASLADEFGGKAPAGDVSEREEGAAWASGISTSSVLFILLAVGAVAFVLSSQTARGRGKNGAKTVVAKAWLSSSSSLSAASPYSDEHVTDLESRVETLSGKEH